MRIASLLCVGALALSPGCVNRRVIVLENKLLKQENAELQRRLAEMEKSAPDPTDYVRDPSLQTIHEFLDRAGYVHAWSLDATHIHMEFGGQNTTFAVNVQHFPQTDVVFVGISDYLELEDAQNTQAVVLLLVQLAALNYELLLGKFQINPESGEIMLSSELHVGDGLGYSTFIKALEYICQTADARYPELERAASGVGL